MNDPFTASTDFSPHERSQRQGLMGACVWMAAVLLGARLLHLIDGHAVNILYWDQWGIYEPLFRNQNLWENFRLQHGVHRQGVGGLLIKFVADLSHWNSRIEALAIGGMACLAALSALRLKTRVIGRAHV